MARTLLASLFLLAAALPARADEPDPEPPGVRPLAGTWVMIERSNVGAIPPVGVGLDPVTVVFKNDRMTLGRNPPSKVRIDLSQKPSHIDFLRWPWKKGQTFRGIFKLEKDTLTLCLGKLQGKRPTDFNASKSDEVIVLKKQK
jgi:uncharacterized protein (TIGR03067 family)